MMNYKTVIKVIKEFSKSHGGEFLVAPNGFEDEGLQFLEAKLTKVELGANRLILFIKITVLSFERAEKISTEIRIGSNPYQSGLEAVLEHWFEDWSLK